MLSSSSLSLIFVAGALAQTTADLFVPNFPVVAFPVATANAQTTYLVACTAGSNPSTCSFAQPYTMVEGPSTASFAMSIPGSGVATVACDLEGVTSMACSATGAVGGSIVTATTTVTGVAAETHFRAINLVTNTAALLTYPAPTTSSTSTTSTSTPHNSTTIASKTALTNSTTSFPTATSQTLIGTAPANITTPISTGSSTGSPPATSSTPANAGALAASSNLGGVFSAVVAIGAVFLAGVL